MIGGILIKAALFALGVLVGAIIESYVIAEGDGGDDGCKPA
jgi:hypothetical protein